MFVVLSFVRRYQQKSKYASKHTQLLIHSTKCGGSTQGFRNTLFPSLHKLTTGGNSAPPPLVCPQSKPPDFLYGLWRAGFSHIQLHKPELSFHDCIQNVIFFT